MPEKLSIQLTADQIQIIIRAIEVTDPSKIYAGDLPRIIAEQANEQIKAEQIKVPEPEVPNV